MDYLKELDVTVSENLNYSDIFFDLPSHSESFDSDFGHQPELNMMNNEEAELALNCAMNIKKHLTRVLATKSETSLQHKLQYVNNLIQEGGLRNSLN